ncbi:DUF4129 domain-containing protein [Streptacidiphilus sp. P02-A3a]|uniref:DUF4129 domain-containing protein n=1 Tax=Streptacidiphilus sp. P02-A3a TaxID=2704468 RepID=UPI0015F7DAC8|nr:DUF4129 domain-containing protein [Streptacidiphilus sp. P02-A3a]QMU68397.1 DUF4129 domain-containing protein [Streptacidiphilus sp. P02-A3a]
MGTGTGAQGVADQAGDRRADPAVSRSPRTPAPPRPLGPLLGLASAVGLALAALCLHATGGVPQAGTGPLTGYWLLLALGTAVGGSMLAVKYRVRQEERPGISAREERFTRLTVFGVFAIAAATTVWLIVIGSGQPVHTQAPPRPPDTTPPTSQPSTPAQPHPVAAKNSGHPFDLRPYLILLVVLIILAVLGLIIYYLVRYLPTWRRTPGIVAAPPAAEADEVRLAEAVNAGRLALRGDDSRAAVIACYAAMEASLAANGLGRHLSDSPADLLGRAAAAGLLDGPAPDALADLFREARYSSHPMGPEHLHRARAALDEISATLLAHRARAEAEADAWALGEDDPAAPDRKPRHPAERQTVTR